MFAAPHARLEQHEYGSTTGSDSYSYVAQPPPIPLNALSYQPQHATHGHHVHHEQRRSISLPQTPAGGAQLHHMPQAQQHYFIDDLSPSSSAAPPNIARGAPPQQQQQHQQQQQQHQMYMSPAGMVEELPMMVNGMHVLPPTLPRRARGERISSKDFIPPDVSGLSKREARLVKNRAAAYLSRQRKREEYEAMEQRVADLEAQNRNLLGQLSGSMQAMAPSEAHAQHIGALQSRIATLEHELATMSAAVNSRSPSPSSLSSQSSSHHSHRSIDSTHSVTNVNQQSIGMGLMALLSLSSMSPPTTKFAFTPASGAEEPTPVTATPFNYESIARWQARLAESAPAPPQDEQGHATTTEFDIAFSQTDDNRIRCHVSVPHQGPLYASPEYATEPLPGGSHPGSASSYVTTFQDAGAWQQPQQLQPVQQHQASVQQQLGPARRVRIALRTAQVGNTSGEWEVEVC